MSVRWERLFGEPSSLAVRLAFHHDPDAGAAATFPANGPRWRHLPRRLSAAVQEQDRNLVEGQPSRRRRRRLESCEKFPDDGLSHLVFDEPIDAAQPPWQQGYDLAEELLDEVGRDLATSSTNLSAWLADWRVRVKELSLNDSELRAVAFVSDLHAPTIALNTSHRSAADPRARRFTLAHELCHLLHDRSYGASLATASGPWAPDSIEKRANAFAAWLLMPPDRLKLAIDWAPSAINTPAGIRAVADKLEVSQSALVRHLFNLAEITEDDQDELLAGSSIPMRG